MFSIGGAWKPLLAYSLVLKVANAGLVGPYHAPPKTSAAVPGPKIAVLGDSFASGVAYFDNNLYDGNNDNGCYRWNQAAAAQLEADKDDFTGKVDMQFVACSGSRLGNIAAGSNGQTQQVKGGVDVVVLTIGGNDAHFYDVASNCIFHDRKKDYGALWPDETGACGSAINDADAYINSQAQEPSKSLEFDLRATYDDMLKSNPYQTLPRTYHTGYIHFFNVAQTGADDWCEAKKETFDINPVSKTAQPLLNSLRTRINALVEDYNTVLKKVTADYADKKFSYLEISAEFNGHRFCEKGSNHRKQYYDNNVWLWNVSPPLADNDSPKGDPLDFPAELQKVYETGLWNTTSTEDRDFFPQSGKTGPGWTLRPMHPKKDGYTAIKNAIIKQMKQDGIGGVK